jgi:hypothetical protein
VRIGEGISRSGTAISYRTTPALPNYFLSLSAARYGGQARCNDCAVISFLLHKQTMLYVVLKAILPCAQANISFQASHLPSEPSPSLPHPHKPPAPFPPPPEPSTGSHPKPANPANRAKAALAFPQAAAHAAQPSYGATTASDSRTTIAEFPHNSSKSPTKPSRSA